MIATETPTAVSSMRLLGVSRERLEYRIGKWKDERTNKQREMLQLKTEIDVLERTIAEMEDIINDKRNLQSVCG